jgi:hypothetical protein
MLVALHGASHAIMMTPMARQFVVLRSSALSLSEVVARLRVITGGPPAALQLARLAGVSATGSTSSWYQQHSVASQLHDERRTAVLSQNIGIC